MFGLLKDKLSGFVNKLIKREEEKPGTPTQPAASETPAPISKPPKKEERKPQTHQPEAHPSERRVEPKARKESAHEAPKHAEKKSEGSAAHKKEAPEPKKTSARESKPAPKAVHVAEAKKETRATHKPAPSERKTESPAQVHAPKMEPEPQTPAVETTPLDLEPAVGESKPAEITPASAPAHAESKPAEKKAEPMASERTQPTPPLPTQAAPAPQPSAAPKKDLLHSIWPFAKKEEKKAPAKIESAPIQPESKHPPASLDSSGASSQTSSQTLKTEAQIAGAKTPASAPAPVGRAEAPRSERAKTPAPASARAADAAASAGGAKPKAREEAEEALRLQATPEGALEDDELARLEKRAMSEQERELKVKMGLGKSVLGFLAPQVTIEESDVRDLLDELELALLESDVAIEVSTEVVNRLRAGLVGMKVDKGQVQQEVARQMQRVLTEVMTSKASFDFIQRVRSSARPVKILFIGPNGAGKTTTMAKLAHRLQADGLSVVFAAGDTFRAAAIEQTEVHGQRLGVPVIKSKYGADPASVAFDAVNYAKAHNVDVVLIDSAGRQDTNANLLDELKKINRVVAPDLKIYIGESIGGHALMDQVRGFHEAIGIDGAILTKLDCDAKGGTALSLTFATGVPILFLGTGQRYEDLEVFDADKVAGQILGGSAS